MDKQRVLIWYLPLVILLVLILGLYGKLFLKLMVDGRLVQKEQDTFQYHLQKIQQKI